MNDLEWIARKVNKPDRRMKYSRSNTDHMAVLVSPIKYKDSLPFLNEFFSGEEVVAERARLQNKPDWSTAPDWAEWLAQDGDDGGWYWYEEQPCANSREFISAYMIDTAGKKGEILGDFRDTLEPRPEEQTMTKKEWRGPEDGLPPLGIGLDGVKRFSQNGVEEWQNEPYWRVVGHHIDGKTFFVEAVNVEKPFTQKFSIECNGEPQYRALRTEEEKAVEDMMRIWTHTTGTDGQRMAMLYRKGYRKQESSE